MIKQGFPIIVMFISEFSLPFKDISDLRVGKIRDGQCRPSDEERGRRSSSWQSEPVKCVWDDECVMAAVSRWVMGIVATIAADVIPVCIPLSAKLNSINAFS